MPVHQLKSCYVAFHFVTESGSRSKKSGSAGTRARSDDASSTAASATTQQTGAGNSTDRNKHRRRRAKQGAAGKTGKDFIQRNIDVSDYQISTRHDQIVLYIYAIAFVKRKDETDPSQNLYLENRSNICSLIIMIGDK